MFTGIVQHMGRVASLTPADFGGRLAVDPCRWLHQPQTGESIAVNGCCLTIAEPVSTTASSLLVFDVIHQTLGLTTLGGLEVGDPVNLEHAATPTTLLGGHIVQGHIDGVGEVGQILKSDGEHRVRITPPATLMDCLVERGSVAIEGVSLTIAGRGDHWIEVALIPTTLQKTTLASLKPGSKVNLEADYVAKLVLNQVRALTVRTS